MYSVFVHTKNSLHSVLCCTYRHENVSPRMYFRLEIVNYQFIQITIRMCVCESVHCVFCPILSFFFFRFDVRVPLCTRSDYHIYTFGMNVSIDSVRVSATECINSRYRKNSNCLSAMLFFHSLSHSLTLYTYLSLFLQKFS